MKKVAVSGIQSSGNLHLGNYLGSIKNWLNMQSTYDCYFFLADLHSLTTHKNAQELQKSIIESAAIYLASGLDPNKSTIFLQSSIAEHSQLAWMLNCVTPMGWLKRMTQFKDKAGKQQDSANTGLFTYPILMAADILLYHANVVPVGEDQKQHIELVRDIASMINRKFDKEIFTIPNPLIEGSATRVMSLRDGTKKMSKSDPSDASRINLHDTPDVIVQKFKKSKTDTLVEITYDKKNRPEVTNLLNIYSALSESSIDTVVDNYRNKGFAIFKRDLADLTIDHLQPIQNEFNKIIDDKEYIKQTLNIGALKARKIASKTCSSLMTRFGL